MACYKFYIDCFGIVTVYANDEAQARQGIQAKLEAGEVEYHPSDTRQGDQADLFEIDGEHQP